MKEADTDLAICECIFFTLDIQHPTQVFVSFSKPRPLTAAQAQDKIGLVHMTESKLLAQLQYL
jgi:hypothetical protein